MRDLGFLIFYFILLGATALSWLAFIFIVHLVGIQALGSSPIIMLFFLMCVCLTVFALMDVTKADLNEGWNEQFNKQSESTSAFAEPEISERHSKESNRSYFAIFGGALLFGLPILHGEYKSMHHRKVTKHDKVNRDFAFPEHIAYYSRDSLCDALCSALLHGGYVKKLTVYDYRINKTTDNSVKIASSKVYRLEKRKHCFGAKVAGNNNSYAAYMNSLVGRCIIGEAGGDQTETLQIVWDREGITSKHRDKFGGFSRLRITKGNIGFQKHPSKKDIIAQKTIVYYGVLNIPLIWPGLDKRHSGGVFGDRSYNYIRKPLDFMRVISPLGDVGDEKLKSKQQKNKFVGTYYGKPEPEVLVNYSIKNFGSFTLDDMPMNPKQYQLAREARRAVYDINEKRKTYRKKLAKGLLNAAQLDMEYRLGNLGIVLDKENALIESYYELVYNREGYDKVFYPPSKDIKAFEEYLMFYLAAVSEHMIGKDELGAYDKAALEAAVRILTAQDSPKGDDIETVWGLVRDYPTNKNYGFQSLATRHSQKINPIIAKDILPFLASPSFEEALPYWLDVGKTLSPEMVNANDLLSGLESLPVKARADVWFELISKLPSEVFSIHLDRVVSEVRKHKAYHYKPYAKTMVARFSEVGPRAQSVLIDYLYSKDSFVRTKAAFGLCKIGGRLSNSDYEALRDELMKSYSARRSTNKNRAYISLFAVSGYADRFLEDVDRAEAESKRPKKWNLKKSALRYGGATVKDCAELI